MADRERLGQSERSLFRRAEGDRIIFWCPACEDAHVISVAPGGWTWDEASLTVSPSILVQGVQWDESSGFHRGNHQGVAVGAETRCHSFLRDGVWEFLGDCTHAMAGQKVPMVEWPHAEADDA